MTAIPLVDPATATGKAKDLLDQVKRAMGMVPNMTRAMAASPPVLEGYLKFAGALAGGSLDAPTRELIALTVAEANRCQYCASAHTVMGKGAGLGDGEIAAGRDGASSDPKTDAILKLAHRLVVSHGELSDAELRTAERAGLTGAVLAEIVANVAINIFTNYFNTTARTPVDFPAVRPVGRAVAHA